MSEQRTVSLNEFAKMVGVDPTVASRAITKGRIGNSFRRTKDGKLRIYAQEAAALWEENRHIAYIDNPKSKAPGANGNTELSDEELKDITAMSMSRTNAYNQAKAVEKTFQAKLAQIEYNEKVGELVCKDAVQKTIFEMARKVRNNILNIPSKIMDKLASITDPYEVEKILLDEIYKCLEDLSDEFK